MKADALNIPSSEIWEKTETRLKAEYTITDVLSSSTCFCIYNATRFGRKLIIKSLQPEFRTDIMYQEMLLKEFEILVSLQHPNIVRVLDFTEVVDLGPCIIMEHVEGQTLDRFLSTQPSSALRAHIIDRLLDALSYLQSKRIVHRDLKPTNIIIGNNGQDVRLIDFGLSDASNYLVLKQAAGTPGYVSPEQESGGAPDHRNDMYSLGQIIRLVRPPFPYRLVANGCQRPLPKRPTATQAIRLLNVVRWCKRATLTALLTLIVGMFAWWMYQRNQVYRISNADELMEYAQLVNEGLDTKDAILTADIDMTGKEWEPIGLLTHPFTRSFDGQGHRISNLICDQPDADNIGFFGAISGNVNISYFILDKTCTLHGFKAVGAIGACVGTVSAKLDRIGNEGTVIADNRRGSGILGSVNSDINKSYLHICDCYATGDIISKKGGTQICGYLGPYAKVENCWSNSSVTSDDPPLLLTYQGYYDVTFSHCYTTTNQDRIGVTRNCSDEDFRSGRIAFLLNHETGKDTWRQTIGTDFAPTFSTKSKQLYANAHLKCDGTILSIECSNDRKMQQIQRDEHAYVGGFCQNPGCTSPFQEPEQDTKTGEYLLRNWTDIGWLDLNCTANARLENDIDLSQYPDVYINNYRGVFDGQGHTITVHYESDNLYTALFHKIMSNSVVRNLQVKGEIIAHRKNAAGIAGRNFGLMANCVSFVNITSDVQGDASFGGLCGILSHTATISDCLFAGSINAPEGDSCGGLVGWSGNSNANLIDNCLCASQLGFLPKNSDALIRNYLQTSILRNCYYVHFINEVSPAAKHITAEQVADGTACRLLNEGKRVPQWIQPKGSPYPLPFAQLH